MTVRYIKRSFTLIEVMLGFSIVSILIFFLFYSLRSSAISLSKTEQISKQVFARNHLYKRLSQAFSQIEPCITAVQQQGQSAFHTDETSSLHFVFDYGIDPEECFTGMVLGKLSLENHHVYLEISPLKPSASLRKETLLSGVKAMAFTFYERSPKSAEDFKSSTQWTLHRTSLPYALTISITFQDNSSTDYTFYLSSHVFPIQYDLSYTSGSS